MELFRALGALCEPPSEASDRLLGLLEIDASPREGEYERLFLFQLYPYASVYLGTEGKVGGEARDRIAGFWRALDLEPPPESDHLALMLGLHARLVELETTAKGDDPRAAWRHARQAWFWEHLASWLPVYLGRVAELGDKLYRSWARILLEALGGEAQTLDPPDRTALHLRESPALDDPRAAPDPGAGTALVDQLLAPVRTGFVLVASDLRRAAGDLELALRAGERRFVLEALIGQDASGTLSWLADFAAAQARAYDHPDLALFELAIGHWRKRALDSAALLTELAVDARGD